MNYSSGRSIAETSSSASIDELHPIAWPALLDCFARTWDSCV